MGDTTTTTLPPGGSQAFVVCLQKADTTDTVDTLVVTLRAPEYSPDQFVEKRVLVSHRGGRPKWHARLGKNTRFTIVPTPFNPTARIMYSLRARGPVKIQVFDIQGRLVRTLVDEEKNAGEYVVEWHGRNNAGGSVASGIYFVRLQTGSTSTTRKAVFIK
jgi:hypothetical protein